MVSLTESSLPLAAPNDFNFPYELPYEIQMILMRHVYSAIESRSAAVVESPTGTGKSLTLLCSSLTWLQDDAERSKRAALETLREQLEQSHKGEPRWILEQEIQRHQNEYESHELELAQRLETIRVDKEKRRQEMKSRANYARKKVRTKEDMSSVNGDADGDDAFAPDDYQEAVAFDDDGLTPEVKALMTAYHGRGGNGRWRGETEDQEPDVRKIYFASRTHSQLTQFQSELRKTKFADAIRTIPLGSRQNLCINDEVRSGCHSVDMLNDRCLDLQKADKGKRCEYLPPVGDLDRLEQFRDHALSQVHSIDDLEELGRELKTCPYYGSRKAIKQAQLVTLPYNLLLLKSAREALGIDLRDNVVIVDEAHNLIDTVLGLHSVEITSTQLTFARAALLTYIKRFKSRFKGSNAVHLRQLAGILSSLANFCSEWISANKADQMITAAEMVKHCNAGQTNFRELDRYLVASKIAQKISGYMENLEAKANTDGRQQSRSAKVTAIHKIQAFILTLANADQDGRVLISTNTTGISLRYQLLNPADAFSSFVDARSVIVAGGTMAPLSDFAQQLLTFLPESQIKTLSCSHVVPQEHVLARAVTQGPSGYRLEFKYEQRNDTKMLDEYGATLLNLVNVVAKGIVVFFPSYASLELFCKRWEVSGILSKIRQKKAIFLEPRNGTETDEVLRGYAASVYDNSHGAILLAVVGAKLSEGINFQDDLCRCVAVIGIPYPSSQSVELRERMKYVSSVPSIPGQLAGEAAGKRLYSNLAFRAVNQSIGRSIRHVNDWSAILLLDARYAQPTTQSKLPTWISQNMESPSSFGKLVKDVATFMKARRS